MNTITPQLPTVLGSLAGMLVAFLGLLNGTSPGMCLIKAGAAFAVLAGIGLILRHALMESAERQSRQRSEPGSLASSPGGASNLDVIVPGTSVADLLAAHNDPAPGQVYPMEGAEQRPAA